MLALKKELNEKAKKLIKKHEDKIKTHAEDKLKNMFGF